MTIYFGADHRGFQLKEQLVSSLKEEGYTIEDCGNDHLELTDDYPDFAIPVAEKVVAAADARGVVLCGSGVGAAIAANKVAGARAAVAISQEQVISARTEDNINVLVLAADTTKFTAATKFISAFLTTNFNSEPRYERRIRKIKQYESLS